MKKIFILPILILGGACQPANDNRRGEAVEEVEIDTSLAVQIGETLFFGSFLSLDSSISCSSCHLPAFAFADTSKVSKGVHGQVGFRNTPSIFNLSEKEHFFMEGGVRSLSRATLGPMLTEEEMSLQAPELLERIASDNELHQQFVLAYGEDYEYRDVVDALVRYQLSLKSKDAEWDEFTHNSSGDELWIRGKALFQSDSLNCSSCHPAPAFRDNSFHDLGLPLNDPVDYGRGRFTFDSTDYYKFSTPSLRNAELTAPYMHDGSLETLDEVIRWYEQGGVRTPNDLSTRFSLKDEDRKALLRFLESLTGKQAKMLHEEAQSN